MGGGEEPRRYLPYRGRINLRGCMLRRLLLRLRRKPCSDANEQATDNEKKLAKRSVHIFSVA
jgi:hypothetical protein